MLVLQAGMDVRMDFQDQAGVGTQHLHRPLGQLLNAVRVILDFSQDHCPGNFDCQVNRQRLQFVEGLSAGVGQGVQLFADLLQYRQNLIALSGFRRRCRC